MLFSVTQVTILIRYLHQQRHLPQFIEAAVSMRRLKVSDVAVNVLKFVHTCNCNILAYMARYTGSLTSVVYEYGRLVD